MSERVLKPVGRGFLLLDSHPDGCLRTVSGMRDETAAQPGGPGRSGDRRPVALVIGSSAGYGLATTVAGLARYGINGVGVCFERAPSGRRTATAGWYRTVALARLAGEVGSDFSFVNADAFADVTKDEVLDLVAKRLGPVDYLIYSVAAPRRVDPRSGLTYHSVIKPIGSAHRTKTIQFGDDGAPVVTEVAIEPATEAEVAETVGVMGGEDWVRWVDALDSRSLLGPGFATVALSYIGSHLTAPLYRQGSIGAAKADLEQTAAGLARRPGVRALTSVNGAAVTQASTAIPGIGLYISILHKVMGADMRTPVRQSVELWDQLTGTTELDTDDEGRIRLDRWELADDVQAEVGRRWAEATSENIATLGDPAWFHATVRRLYGFDVEGVDYERPTEPDVDWPSADR
jgi:enoyl-[acyl-carrier protein] reductase/trans-2-enoyl-CoA reductase (NAD+)